MFTCVNPRSRTGPIPAFVSSSYEQHSSVIHSSGTNRIGANGLYGPSHQQNDFTCPPQITCKIDSHAVRLPPTLGHSNQSLFRRTSKLHEEMEKLYLCSKNLPTVVYSDTLLLICSLLQDVSHVILDEIHERDVFSDFLLIIVKDLLPLRCSICFAFVSVLLPSFLSAYKTFQQINTYNVLGEGLVEIPL